LWSDLLIPFFFTSLKHILLKTCPQNRRFPFRRSSFLFSPAMLELVLLHRHFRCFSLGPPPLSLGRRLPYSYVIFRHPILPASPGKPFLPNLREPFPPQTVLWPLFPSRTWSFFARALPFPFRLTGVSWRRRDFLLLLGPRPVPLFPLTLSFAGSREIPSSEIGGPFTRPFPFLFPPSRQKFPPKSVP